MIITLIELWLYSAIGLVATHLIIAFIVDKSITMGTWAKGALILFSLLGPLGVVLEAVLLFSVLKDIARQKITRRVAAKKQRKAHQTRWQRQQPEEQELASIHG
jgi:putative effector of murein hydrolase